MEKSAKQKKLENKIKNKLSDKALGVVQYIFNDEEILAYQDYANIVSIKRLGYNDHGPVHMLKAALNSLIMFELLNNAGIKFNLEKEVKAETQDSKIAVLIAALLHDLGMTIARDNHEFMSTVITSPLIDRILEQFYHDNILKKVAVKATILEGIFGHMATQTIHSLEAGLVLIGDGCDMEKGRARITTILSNKPKIGDIHKYSSRNIDKVHILPGDKKPIKILIEMRQSVGFFQVEEVLFPKIASSPVKRYIELLAGVKGKEIKKYL